MWCVILCIYTHIYVCVCVYIYIYIYIYIMEYYSDSKKEQNLCCNNIDGPRD